MKTLSRRFGQWSMVVCATAGLVVAPAASFGAESTANPAADQAATPAVQVVKSAVGTLPPNYKPSPSLDEVLKLAQSGVGDEVLLAFIENSKKDFNPSPEDIIYLNDLGVSEAAIAALIRAKPGTPTAASATATANPPPAPTGSVPVYTAPATAPQINGVVAQPAPEYVAPAPVVVVQQSPEQQVTVTQFYDSLAPYGNWVYVADYGYCWQPTVAVVDVSWRPYAQRGRWAYTDCGWYWQSDYSWGWAPFHYGRWWRHPHSGWLWTPDTVWGPSWVSWRHHDSYCGWAPLPPAAHFRPGVGFSFHGGSVGVGFDFGLSFDFFTFVPTRHFADRRPYAHAVARSQVTQVYNHSTVVNNYTTINKTTVVNHGIDHKIIAKASPTPITRVTLREAPAQQVGTKITHDRGARPGAEPSLYRTQLTTPRPEKVQHVMTELRQNASRGVVAKPGKAPAAIAQPIVRDTGAKPAFPPRAEAVIPKPRTPQSAPATAEVPVKGKMSDERVNRYINELKTRKEGRTESTVGQPAVTQNPAVGKSPAGPGTGIAARQPQTQQAPQPRVVQPAQQPGGERANQYLNDLKTRQQARPQNSVVPPASSDRTIAPAPTVNPSAPVITLPPAQRKNVAVAQPQPQPQPQPRVIPQVQPQPVQQQRAVEGAQRAHQRGEQPAAGRQPTVNHPAEAPRTGGGAGRQSAPVYVPPPNPPRTEAPASSGRSSGQEPSGRQSGGGKSDRNDRK